MRTVEAQCKENLHLLSLQTSTIQAKNRWKPAPFDYTYIGKMPRAVYLQPGNMIHSPNPL